jgi:hypothetical protein
VSSGNRVRASRRLAADSARTTRATIIDHDVYEPSEPEQVYAPEQRIAMQVFFQAVSDLTSKTGGPRHQDSAAQFLLACDPYRDVHAFWCHLIGIDPKAAVEQVMRRHGTQIARIRSWAVRQTFLNGVRRGEGVRYA